MKVKNLLTLQTLLMCVLIMGALAAVYVYAAAYVLQEVSRHLTGLWGQAGTAGNATPAIADLRNFLETVRQCLVPGIAATAGAAALLLWLLVQGMGRSAVNRAGGPRDKAEPAPAAVEAGQRKEPVKYSPAPAVQLLAILQRQGRFVDFLQEDLRAYEDAQIGAAVRSVQEGCKKALSEHVKLEPVFKEEEGSEVTIQPDFDAYTVRLTGNVAGDPPFQGTIRHRGWRVVGVDLPRQMEEREGVRIVAPAEVEVAG